METSGPPKYVVPNARIPKVVGMLNIVFASALMLCGLCSTAYFVVVIPMMSKAMAQVQNKVQKTNEAQRKTALESLDDQEKAATTEEQKEAIRSQRRQIEAQPTGAMPIGMDLEKLGLNDPKLIALTWVDLGTGLLLNALMLTAGIGLVGRKPWSVNLGLGVAGMKILRLVLVYGYVGLVLVPRFSRRLAEAALDMVLQQQKAMGRPMPPGMSVDLLAQTYTIIYTVMTVGMVLFGIIYPIVCLWLLSRPSVRAACSVEEASRPPSETGETW